MNRGQNAHKLRTKKKEKKKEKNPKGVAKLAADKKWLKK
jgi:hypothetical protein